MPNINTPWSVYDYSTGLSALFYAGTRDTPITIGDGFAMIWYRTVFGLFTYHFTFAMGAATTIPNSDPWYFEFPEPMSNPLAEAIAGAFDPYFLADAHYVKLPNFKLGVTAITIDDDTGLAVGQPLCDVGDGTVFDTQPFTWATHSQLESGNALPALDG